MSELVISMFFVLSSNEIAVKANPTGVADPNIHVSFTVVTFAPSVLPKHLDTFLHFTQPFINECI